MSLSPPIFTTETTALKEPGERLLEYLIGSVTNHLLWSVNDITCGSLRKFCCGFAYVPSIAEPRPTFGHSGMQSPALFFCPPPPPLFDKSLRTLSLIDPPSLLFVLMLCLPVKMLPSLTLSVNSNSDKQLGK